MRAMFFENTIDDSKYLGVLYGLGSNDTVPPMPPGSSLVMPMGGGSSSGSGSGGGGASGANNPYAPGMYDQNDDHVVNK
jgi:hypothetical protein